MMCPKCSGETAVTDSRPANGGIAWRRRRSCLSDICAHRFSTIEAVRDPEGEALSHQLKHLLSAARILKPADIRLLTTMAGRLWRPPQDADTA